MAKKPGVGFNPSNRTVVWQTIGAENDPSKSIRVSLDAFARPWGPDGGVPAARGAQDYTAYLQRYAAGDPSIPKGRHVQGEDNERWHLNEEALRKAFTSGRLENQSEEWDGNPTTEECYDLAATTARGTGFYALLATTPSHPVEPVPSTPTPKPEPIPPPAPAELDQLRHQLAIANQRITSLLSTLSSINPPSDILGTLLIIKDWTGVMTIGPGRTSRLKRLVKWGQSVKMSVDEALKSEEPEERKEEKA
jgi:hypothetical protein